MTTLARRVDGGYVLRGPEDLGLERRRRRPLRRVRADRAGVAQQGRDGVRASSGATRACASAPRCASSATAGSSTPSCSWMTCSCPTTGGSATEGAGLQRPDAHVRPLARRARRRLRRHRARRLRVRRRIRARARAVRQADHRAPGGRVPARRRRDAHRRRAAADLARRRGASTPASASTREAAMAKLYASEAAMFATWAAVQTLGGWGYSREYPVEKWFRDAKLEEIWEGTLRHPAPDHLARDLARVGRDERATSSRSSRRARSRSLGASTEPGVKWGYWLAQAALRGRRPAAGAPRQPPRRRDRRPGPCAPRCASSTARPTSSSWRCPSGRSRTAVDVGARRRARAR